MLRVYLLIFVLGLVGIFGYGAYWYYTDTQNRIAQLRENNAKLEVANQQNQAAIDTLQQQAVANAARMQSLQTELQKAEQYGDELRATLQRHNLTDLARRKPGLIQNRINNASDKLLDEIISDTTPNSSPAPN